MSETISGGWCHLQNRVSSHAGSTIGAVHELFYSLVRSAGFPFLFHQIHRRTHFKLDKDSTPSGPKFWTCGRSWRWRRTLIQLRNLDLDVHDRHRWDLGIGDVWPKKSSEHTREVHHWRRHHPTVIVLHGIAARVTKHSAGLGLCAKRSKEYYC